MNSKFKFEVLSLKKVVGRVIQNFDLIAFAEKSVTAYLVYSLK